MGRLLTSISAAHGDVLTLKKVTHAEEESYSLTAVLHTSELPLMRVGGNPAGVSSNSPTTGLLGHQGVTFQDFPQDDRRDK